MRLYPYIITLCALGVLASCSQSDEPGVTPPYGNAETVLSLVIERPRTLGAGAPTPSDGTWAGDYDKFPGDGFESWIDPGKLLVTIEDPANGATVDIHMTATQLSTGDYECHGMTTSPLPVGTARIVVKANSRTDLFDQSSLPSGLPMWGVTTRVLDRSSEQDLGQVQMLRAVAKVDVQLSKALALEGFTIEAASVANVNPTGTLVPGNAASANTTGELAWEPAHPKFCFNPTSTAAVPGMPFTLNTITQDSVINGTPKSVTSISLARLYLPEMGTTTPDQVAVNITLRHKGALMTYEEALFIPTPLVRNHYLRFTINSVQPHILTYWVCTWHEHNITLPDIE